MERGAVTGYNIFLLHIILVESTFDKRAVVSDSLSYHFWLSSVEAVRYGS